MPKCNPASRLLRVLTIVRGAADGNVLDIWAEAFGVIEMEEHARERAVTHLLGIAYEQTVLLEREAIRRGAAAEDLAPELDRLRSALSARWIGQNWSSTVKQRITDSVFAALRYVRGSLDDELDPLTAAGIENARRELETLRGQISAADDLPPLVRDFLNHQLDLVVRAVDEYAIRGADAFRVASDEAAADWLEHAQEIEPYRHRSEVTSVLNIWTTVATHASAAILVGKTMVALLHTAAVGAIGAGVQSGLLPPTDVAVNLEALSSLVTAGAHLKRLVKESPSGESAKVLQDAIDTVDSVGLRPGT